MLSTEKLADAVGDRWSDSELGEAVELLTRADGRFPAGVRTLPADLVKAVQRERLLAAMLGAVTEIGYNTLTVQNVLDPGGHLPPHVLRAVRGQGGLLPRRLRRLGGSHAASASRRRSPRPGPAGATSCAAASRSCCASSRRSRKRLAWLIVEARASSPAGLRRRDELLDHFAACIDALVREDLDEPPSAIAAAGVVGGIESVLYARLQKGEIGDLDALLPSLMYFAVLAYAGREAAGEELDDAALA